MIIKERIQDGKVLSEGVITQKIKTFGLMVEKESKCAMNGWISKTSIGGIGKTNIKLKENIWRLTRI